MYVCFEFNVKIPNGGIWNSICRGLEMIGLFHYNPSVRIIDLVSHNTYVVCVNFIHKWRDLQFKVDFENTDFLRKLFMAILFTLRVFARNLLKGNRRRNIYFLYFVLMSGLGLEPCLQIWLFGIFFC